MNMESCCCSAQRQYAMIFRLRDITVLLYILFSEILPFTILHDLLRIGVCVFHVFMLLYTDTKEPLKAQLVWQSIFMLYFTFHSLFGLALNTSVAFVQISRIFVQMFILNAIVCMAISEKGLLKFMNIYTWAILAKVVLAILLQRGSLITIRLGTLSFPLPIIGFVKYNANSLGMSCSLVFFFQVYILTSLKKQRRRIFIMLFCVAAIMLTGSRKALIMMLFLLFVFLFFYQPEHRIKTVLIVGIFVSIVGFLLMNVESLYEVAGKRLEDTIMSAMGEESQESSAKTRNEMIDSGLEWVLAKPLTGYGLDCYRFLSRYNTYSHNNYIELAVSGGIWALPIYYWYYAYIIWKNITQYKNADNKKIRALSICTAVILPVLEYGWVTYHGGIPTILLALGSTYQARLNYKRKE